MSGFDGLGMTNVVLRSLAVIRNCLGSSLASKSLVCGLKSIMKRLRLVDPPFPSSLRAIAGGSWLMIPIREAWIDFCNVFDARSAYSSAKSSTGTGGGGHEVGRKLKSLDDEATIFRSAKAEATTL